MLEILASAEKALPKMLRDESGWNSLYIDYYPPIVERLWRQWGDYRISLHRIHPCKPGESLLHPHTWPSAMRILSGKYRMEIGYSTTDEGPPAAATLELAADSAYEMIEPHGWHSVRPLDGPSLSIMVSGKPWNRNYPHEFPRLGPLPQDTFDKLLDDFRQIYYNK